jgi:plasmid maintenance system killer protein
MIKNFKDKKTEEFFGGKAVKPFSEFKKAAERKLMMLDSATE